MLSLLGIVVCAEPPAGIDDAGEHYTHYMAETFRIEAIVPDGEVIATQNIEKLLDQAIGVRGFSGEMVRVMANYPPARPWRSRPPRTGPRAGGRRTGNLGRGWRMLRRGQLHWVTFNLVEYVGFVQGFRRGRPRQTRVMQQRGWQQVDTEAQRVWERRGYRRTVVRILTQRDPRLDRRRRRRRAR